MFRFLSNRPTTLAAFMVLISVGCQTIAHKFTDWKMLDEAAMDDPIKAVGGDAIVFTPTDEKPSRKESLVDASPENLVAYYAPILIQQRVDTTAVKHPYPPEYDLVGTARLKREAKGELKSSIAGPPTVYAIHQKVPINGKELVQLTYTAWYPAHPRMKTFDLEEADIDSCVMRVTLDLQNRPLFYETIAACGCFHKVFISKRVEESAARSLGAPEQGKKYVVERTVKDAIDWEVAGVVDDMKDVPGRPVVFLKAGDHKVIGIGSTARLRVPAGADARKYALTDYADLYEVPVEGTRDKAPFFDLGNGGKVRGAERKERFVFGLLGVDAAGQPRANDQIKLHFDQSTWSDPTIYSRFLRLPPGTL